MSWQRTCCFATLDPTLRRIRLPHGTIAILSDTVGFISDLPTHLVAAFRATLEEVVEADLVIHLRDIADPDTAAQAQDVEQILRDLGVEPSDSDHVLEVWNKIDLLADTDRERLLAEAAGDADGATISISAATGEGIGALLDRIESRIAGRIQEAELVITADRMALIDWVYRNGSVTARQDEDDGSVRLTVRGTGAAIAEIQGRLSEAE